MDDDLAQRIHRLIALAGSDNENEARNAAHKACELMRKAGVKPADMIPRVELPGLPPPRGWRPPPRREFAPEPEPERHYPRLSYDDGLAERNRLLEAQLVMRASQAARANYELRRAEQQVSELEDENARVRNAAQMAAERARLLRAGVPRLAAPSLARGPTGAGRRERY